MKVERHIKKYEKSIPILKIFLSLCRGNVKEKDIAEELHYPQSMVHICLGQLCKEDFVKMEYEKPEIGQKGRERVFYYPNYWKIIRMNIYPNNKILRKDWEIQENAEKEELIEFLNQEFDTFSKMVYLQMIKWNNKELQNFNLEDLAKDFIKHLVRIRTPEDTEYINKYLDLFFGLWDGSYLDQSVESYKKELTILNDQLDMTSSPD